MTAADERCEDTNGGEINHSGDCQWCPADFGRYGRLLGSLFATLHAYRNHWDKLEEVADGADPEDVDP